MLNVIRIIPKMKLGGVERGLLDEIKVVSDSIYIKYHIFVIEKSETQIPISDNISVIYINKSYFRFYSISKDIKKYISDNNLNNIIILSSLWKSHLVSFFLNNYYRVAFFHSSSYSHFLDHICSKVAYRKFDNFIYDCYTTRDLYSNSGYIVPYVFKQNNIIKTNKKDFSFVFVGRINKVKGLERSLLIISELIKLDINLVFDIYGPDEGEKDKLESLILSYGLTEYVNFKGVIKPENVSKYLSKYTFYMQNSYREGMGASIILSQSVGLIPIVTPVGEIPKYCNNNNSIIIKDFDYISINETATKIINIINDKNQLADFRFNALNAMSNYDFFDDALLDVFSYFNGLFYNDD